MTVCPFYEQTSNVFNEKSMDCRATLVSLPFSSVVGFNALIVFDCERSKTGGFVIDSKYPSCIRISDSSSTGTCC